jgi:hypothetical protein
MVVIALPCGRTKHRSIEVECRLLHKQVPPRIAQPLTMLPPRWHASEVADLAAR